MPADDLRQLAVNLGKVSPQMVTNVRKAFEVTARSIKDDWNQSLREDAGNRLRHTRQTVDYDVGVGIGALAALGGLSNVSIQAEIGPNLGRVQGPFSGWFDSGNVDGVPATNPGVTTLKENAPDFFKGLEIAAADALRDAL